MLTSLMLLLSISSSAQTGTNDSVKCYTTSELRKIAAQMIKKQECDTLLKITNKQLALKLEVVSDQDTQLKILKKESDLKEGIIAEKESKIQNLTDSVKKQKTKTRLAILCGTLVSAGLAALLIIH